jgi:O-antigen/teichoic acid export membrane protein
VAATESGGSTPPSGGVGLRQRLRGEGTGARLARGASGAFGVKIAAAGLGFGLQVLLARQLGTEQYGIFTYAFSWIAVLVLFARLGLSNSVVRYVGTYEATRSWARLRGLLRRSDQWVAGASLAVAGAAAALVFALRERMDPELEKALYLGLGILPLYAALGVKESCVLGFRRPVAGQIPDAVLRPALTGIFVLALVACLTAPVTASVAMLAADAAIMVGFVVAWSLLRRSTPKAVGSAEVDLSPSREWWSLALSLLLIGGMNILRGRTDVLMIGALLDTTDVGFYAASARYADLMLFALQAVNVYAGPVIAGLFARERTSEIQRLVSLAALAIAGIALPLAATLFFLGRPLLRIFGPDFEVGYEALAWLTGGQLVNALSGPVGLLMTMTGHHRSVARVVGVSALANVALNFALIPRYGIAGAAMATAFTAAASNVGMCILVWKRLDVDPTLLSFARRKSSPRGGEHR